MAAIETLQARADSFRDKVNKKEALIAKKQSWIDKKVKQLKDMGYTYQQGDFNQVAPAGLRENSEAFWLWCDIDSYYDDIKSAERDLKEYRDSLVKYEQELKIAQEKSASRNVQVILDFLNAWEQKTVNWLLKEKENFEIAKKEYYNILHKYYDWHNNEAWKLRDSDPAKYKEVSARMNKEENEIRQNFRDEWRYVTQFDSSSRSWEDNMKRMVAQEKDRKYDDIINRTRDLIGEITDASNLSIGAKGDLNGFVIGTNGNKAKIQTIGAGGYNDDIVLDSGRHGQRFHFRTLIDLIK